MDQRPGIRRIFKAVGTAACLVAVLTTLGGHWAVLQSLAWARMIGQYACQGSLAQAVAITFDGKHPCRLCLTIREGRQQEQTEDKKAPSVKPDWDPELVCEVRRTTVPAPPVAASQCVPYVPGWHADFIDSPPTPPPRAA